MGEPQVPPRVLVDFNDLDAAGQLYTLPEDADQPLQMNSRVILWDGEGNQALGRVVEVAEHGRAIVEMTPGSWRREPDDDGLLALRSAPQIYLIVTTSADADHLSGVVVLIGDPSQASPFQYRVSSGPGGASETAPAQELVTAV